MYQHIPIRLVVSDVDGVMTDGGLYYSAQGEEIKKFNVKDGLVAHLLRNDGIKLCIITGRKSEIVEKRFSELKFDFIVQGAEDKLGALKKIASDLQIDLSHVAYIGDDVNDLELLKSVGLAACPSDAIDSLKDHVNYVCQKKGGEGAFREFADYVLTYNKNAG